MDERLKAVLDKVAKKRAKEVEDLRLIKLAEQKKFDNAILDAMPEARKWIEEHLFILIENQEKNGYSKCLSMKNYHLPAKSLALAAAEIDGIRMTSKFIPDVNGYDSYSFTGHMEYGVTWEEEISKK